MHKGTQILPVWFFTGILLFIYGLVVLAAGVNQLSHPPEAVLARYHSGLWGGIVLLCLGGFYILRFWPNRRKQGIEGDQSDTAE